VRDEAADHLGDEDRDSDRDRGDEPPAVVRAVRVTVAVAMTVVVGMIMPVARVMDVLVTVGAVNAGIDDFAAIDMFEVSRQRSRG
jgi:hypothetical protein